MTTQKTVLVTGASSGIGQATAGLLAQRGYRVFGTARDTEHSASLPEGVEFLPLDVTLDDSVEACIAAVLDRSGRIDVLVNNAGYALVGSIEETTVKEAQAIFDTNFFGAVRMTRAVLPSMREQGEGKVILMGVILATPADRAMRHAHNQLDAYTPARDLLIDKFKQDLRAGMPPERVAQVTQGVTRTDDKE